MARGVISTSDVLRCGSIRDATYERCGYYPEYVIISANDGAPFHYAVFSSHNDARTAMPCTGETKVCASSFLARLYELQSAYTPLERETIDTIQVNQCQFIDLFVYNGMPFRACEWDNWYLITDDVSVYPSSFLFRSVGTYLAFDKRIAASLSMFSAFYGSAMRHKLHLTQTYDCYRLLPYVARRYLFGATTSVMGLAGAESAVFYYNYREVSIWQTGIEIARYDIDAPNINLALSEVKTRYHNYIAGFEVL